MVGQHIPFPLNGTNFSYTPIINEERVTMGTAYNTTTVITRHDLIEMLGTFNWWQWMLILLVLFIFFLVLRYGQMWVKGVKKPDAAWIVTMFFINQDYLNEINSFLKIMSITMSFFTFFVLNYMLNATNTDLATQKDPVAAKDYDAFWDQNIKPLWAEGHPVLKYFMQAKEGSIEARVLKHAEEKYNLTNCLVSPSLENVAKLMEDFIQRKSIFMMDQHNVAMLSLVTCNMMRAAGSKYDSIYLFNPTDPRSILRPTAAAFWAGLDPGKAAILIKSVRKFAEYGFAISTVEQFKWKNIERKPSTETCVTTSILTSAPDLKNVSFSNTEKLFGFFFLGIYVAIIVLQMEIMVKRFFDGLEKGDKRQAERHGRKKRRVKVSAQETENVPGPSRLSIAPGKRPERVIKENSAEVTKSIELEKSKQRLLHLMK